MPELSYAVPGTEVSSGEGIVEEVFLLYPDTKFLPSTIYGRDISEAQIHIETISVDAVKLSISQLKFFERDLFTESHLQQTDFVQEEEGSQRWARTT